MSAGRVAPFHCSGSWEAARQRPRANTTFASIVDRARDGS